MVRPKRVSLQEQLLRDAQQQQLSGPGGEQQQQLSGPSEQQQQGGGRPTHDCSLLEVGGSQTGRDDASDGVVPSLTSLEEKSSGGVFSFSSLVVELD